MFPRTLWTLSLLVLISDADFAVKVPSTNFPTIPSALAVADTIELEGGMRYPCGISVNVLPSRNLNISGPISNPAIFDCHGLEGNRALDISGVDSLILRGILFTGSNTSSNQGGGGAVRVSALSAVYIFNCSFFNNSVVAGSSSSAISGGGAVQIIFVVPQSASATYMADFSGTLFHSNSVQDLSGVGGGGAVQILFQKPQQSASSPGTGVSASIIGGEFVQNYASSGSLGGGGGMLVLFDFVANNSNLLVSGGEYHGNLCDGVNPLGGGGLLVFYPKDSYQMSNVSLVFSDMVFMNNTVPLGGGGGLYVQVSHHSVNFSLCIENSNFFGNQVLMGLGGGGVQISLGFSTLLSTLVFRGGLFRGNSASEGVGGGAILVFFTAVNSTSVSVFGGNFTDNSSPMNLGGGAIAILSGYIAQTLSVLVHGGIFLGNQASLGTGGGAVQVNFNYMALDCFIAFEGGNYVSNAADRSQGGGAVQVAVADLSNGTRINLSGGYYYGNGAPRGGGGGAVQFAFSKESIGTMISVENNPIFADNRASESGGGAVEVVFEDIALNTSIFVVDGIFSRNSAVGPGGGGGLQIFFSRSSSNTFVGISGKCRFYDNSALRHEVAVFQDAGTAGGGGGGLQVVFSTSVLGTCVIAINGSEFVNNAAGSNGGALLISMNAPASANLTGGGVFVSNCSFIDNESHGIGGAAAVILPAVDSLSDECQICHEVAPFFPPTLPQCGFPQSDVFCTQSLYAASNSVQNVFLPLAQQLPLTGHNVIFSRNRAICTGCSGGAFAAVNGRVDLASISFESNYASDRGGGVYFGGTATVVLQDVDFVNNTASSDTALIITAQGSVSLRGAVTIQVDTPPPSFFLSTGSFTLLSLIGTGNVTLPSTSLAGAGYEFSCPPGFRLQSTPIARDVPTFFAGWPNPMVTSSWSIICVACNENSYSMQRGSISGNATGASDSAAGQQQCLPCPFGGICAGGRNRVLSSSGYWGYLVLDSSGIVDSNTFSSRAKSSTLLRLQTESSTLLTSRAESSTFLTSRAESSTLLTSRAESSTLSTSQAELSASLRSQSFRLLTESPTTSRQLGTVNRPEKLPVSSKAGPFRSVMSIPSTSLVSSNPPVWSFSRCPIGYCCSARQGCNPRLSDFGGFESSSVGLADPPSCAEGRNASVPLCGACLRGFSQDLRGHTCSPDDLCDDGRWAWPLMFVGALAWAVFLVAGSAKSIEANAQISEHAREVEGAAGERIFDSAWFAPTLLFFIQNVSLLYVSAGSWPIPLVAAITAMSNLHLQGEAAASSTPAASSSDSWKRVCLFQGLSTEGAIGLQLLLPAVVGGMLLLCWIVLKTISMCRGAGVQRLLPPPEFESRILLRFGTAGLKLVMLFYTSIASVTGTLLHCVPISGINGLKVIFRAGGVVCQRYAWQNALIAIFAIIVIPFPLFLFVIQFLVRRRQHTMSSRNLISSASTETAAPTSDSRSGLSIALRSLETPYKNEMWFWPAVVLLRRLFIALVFAFEPDPSSQAVWFTILFSLFSWLHIAARPHRSPAGNIVEIVGLGVLVVTSLSILRTGTLLEAATSTADGSPAHELTRSLNIVNTVLFFIPIGTAIILLIAGYAQHKSNAFHKLMQSLRQVLSRNRGVFIGSSHGNSSSNGSIAIQMSRL